MSGQLVDIIPLSLRIMVRNLCVQWLILREINEIFQGSHISAGTIPTEKVTTSQRRNCVEAYYATCDWTNAKDAGNFLSVVSLLLSLSKVGEEEKARLRALCVDAGFAVTGNTVTLADAFGSGEAVRNIVFAGIGSKPEIVLEDALTNRIKVTSNPGNYLVYSRPVLDRGLLWNDLMDWWRELQHQGASGDDIHASLYNRLRQSLQSSVPERLLFRAYFERFRPRMGNNLPALLPQVYLHYDPYTALQLKRLVLDKRLPRQRMDFLMLLANDRRIVLEVDGQQHYATESTPDPGKYAEMVAEDRRLKLAGYDVFRFGGYELSDTDAEATASDFFESLFTTYGVK